MRNQIFNLKKKTEKKKGTLHVYSCKLHRKPCICCCKEKKTQHFYLSFENKAALILPA